MTTSYNLGTSNFTMSIYAKSIGYKYLFFCLSEIVHGRGYLLYLNKFENRYNLVSGVSGNFTGGIDGNWRYFCLIKYLKYLKMYLDGICKDILNMNNIADMKNIIIRTNEPKGLYVLLTSKISSARIYNIVLTQSEIYGLASEFKIES